MLFKGHSDVDLKSPNLSLVWDPSGIMHWQRMTHQDTNHTTKRKRLRCFFSLRRFGILMCGNSTLLADLLQSIPQPVLSYAFCIPGSASHRDLKRGQIYSSYPVSASVDSKMKRSQKSSDSHRQTKYIPIQVAAKGWKRERRRGAEKTNMRGGRQPVQHEPKELIPSTPVPSTLLTGGKVEFSLSVLIARVEMMSLYLLSLCLPSHSALYRYLSQPCRTAVCLCFAQVPGIRSLAWLILVSFFLAHGIYPTNQT